MSTYLLDKFHYIIIASIQECYIAGFVIKLGARVW